MKPTNRTQTIFTTLRSADLQNIARFLLPNTGDILWIGIFLMIFQFGRQMMNADGDLGRHITIGSYILENMEIPVADLFSHTMHGMALTPHEWLSQVFFAAFYQWLGFAGVTLSCGLIIATTFMLVYRAARSNSGSLIAALVVTLLGVITSALHWLSRPHIYTFLLLALWVHELEALRTGANRSARLRWWTFPLIMVLWANLHGAYIAGFVTWGLYGIGIAADQLMAPGGRSNLRSGRLFWTAYFLAGGTSLLVTLINPSGLGLWMTSVGYLGERFLVDMTIEYRSPDFHSLGAQPFLLWIGLIGAMFGVQRKKIPTAHVLVTITWLVMALYSARNIPLLVIVSAPVLSRTVRDWFEFASGRLAALKKFWRIDQGLLTIDLRSRGYFFPLLSLLLVIWMLIGGRQVGAYPEIGYAPDKFPVAAVDWLVENPQPGRMYNHFPWGGYLLYRLWPDQRVFIDAQTDFYGEALTREYLTVTDVQDGWEEILEKYQVDWIIVPSGEALASQLNAHPSWKPVYEDDTAQIYVLDP